MKHLFAALLLVVTMPAMANDYFYLGAGAGLTNYDSNIDTTWSATDSQAATGNVASGQLFAGWNLNPYFGLEILTMYGQNTVGTTDVKLWTTTIAPKLMLPFEKWHYFISFSPSFAHLTRKYSNGKTTDFDGLGFMFQTGANFRNHRPIIVGRSLYVWLK